MARNFQYEEEWEKHQELLKEVERINKDLKSAEEARIEIIHPDQQDKYKPSDMEKIEARLEELTAASTTATEKVYEYQFEVAKLNPDHGRWLEEKLPPAQAVKLDTEFALDVANTVLEILPEDAPSSGQTLQTLAYTLENAETMKDYAIGGIRKGFENVKELLSEKDAAKNWEKDISTRETELKESHERELQSLNQNKQMMKSQLEDAKKEGFEEKLVQLEKAAVAEKEAIDNRFNNEQGEIDKEKEALENAMDETNDLAAGERNEAIEKRREEFERQQELERQKELDPDL